MFNLYLMSVSLFAPATRCAAHHSPVKLDSLDDKAERRADAVDVFAHNSLDNCGLARIIQSSAHDVRRG